MLWTVAASFLRAGATGWPDEWRKVVQVMLMRMVMMVMLMMIMEEGEVRGTLGEAKCVDCQCVCL